MKAEERRRAARARFERMLEAEERQGKALAQALRDGRLRSVKGWVSDGAGGMIPWYDTWSGVWGRESRELPPSKLEWARRRWALKERLDCLRAEEAFERLSAPLPIRRTSPEERVAALADRLVEEARRSYLATGKVVLPRSIVEDICREYAMAGHFRMTPERIERMALQEIERVLRSYAASTVARSDREYRKDLVPEVRGVKNADH